MTQAWIALSICAFSVSAAAQTSVFDSNGVPIHFEERGSGEPVVLLHGISGNTTNWDTFGFRDALLEAGFRVVAFDARGHGESGKPHDPAQYGREMVDDIRRLLDHLRVPEAHIVGYSMGAGLAQAFRAMHPDRVLTVILGGGGPTSEQSLQEMPERADSIARGDLGARDGSGRSTENREARVWQGVDDREYGGYSREEQRS